MSEMKHILRSQQFDRKMLEDLFLLADQLRNTQSFTQRSQIMASLFYEPSTRTRLSFESAMIRLGGEIIGTENAREFSSAIKGETLEDSIRVVSSYVDVIVLRHNEKWASERAAAVSNVPIINAGDGAGQHPTQALLDLYTIWREDGNIEGKCVVIAGDLKNGRTVRSLAYLLGKYSDLEIVFVSPKELAIGDDIKEYFEKQKVVFSETEDLYNEASRADILYQTRIQQERFADPNEYELYKGMYQIDTTLADNMKKGGIIMHPLPRVDEILPEVDSSDHARYFQQAENGLFIRMALLQRLLGTGT